MQIQRRIIDDFKTDRKDILPPLPAILRLVPILFYCSIGVAVVLASVFWLQLKVAKTRLAQQENAVAQADVQLRQVKEQKAHLDGLILRANNIEKWVTASQPIQPLAVAIARSIQKGSTLVELQLSRKEGLAGQIQLALRLATSDPRQLDRIINAISAEGYRFISPQQSVSNGIFEYKSTLIWQNARQENLEGI